MKVTICIITCERPDGLKRLLDGIEKLTFEKICQPQIDIIVVENGIQNDCRDMCSKHSVNSRFPIHYELESTRGISYARNKSIQAVDSDVDFIACIDDDEVPVPEWLDELLFVQDKYDADVVHGLVKPYFVNEVPQWIVRGDFFDRPSLTNGATIKTAGAGNVIIRKSILENLNPIFDHSFALTGGEDHHLFSRLYRSGFHLVQASNAVAYEWIPSSRTNAKWLIQRAYRSGTTFGVCEKKLTHSVLEIFKVVVKSLLRVIQGVSCVVLSLTFGKIFLLKGLRHISRSLGIFSGLLGNVYEEYRVIHHV